MRRHRFDPVVIWLAAGIIACSALAGALWFIAIYEIAKAAGAK